MKQKTKASYKAIAQNYKRNETNNNKMTILCGLVLYVINNQSENCQQTKCFLNFKLLRPLQTMLTLEATRQLIKTAENRQVEGALFFGSGYNSVTFLFTLYRMGWLKDVYWKDEYKYYDSPEGEDCLKKLAYVTKYCGIYGFIGSTIDILLYSHPKGYGSIVGRYAYITFPIMGMGAAFTAATCAATNLRKKDDKLNYFIGALSAASVWGAWKKSYKIGIYGGLALGLAAVIFKDSVENNWPILKHSRARMNMDSWTLHQDWSLTKDPSPTWRRS